MKTKKPKPVRWLRPVIVRDRIHWPEKCEAEVTTRQTVDWRKAHGTGTHCLQAAKIDYRGTKLCTMHAKVRALDELAGPCPVTLEVAYAG